MQQPNSNCSFGKAKLGILHDPLPIDRPSARGSEGEVRGEILWSSSGLTTLQTAIGETGDSPALVGVRKHSSLTPMLHNTSFTRD